MPISFTPEVLEQKILLVELPICWIILKYNCTFKYHWPSFKAFHQEPLSKCVVLKCKCTFTNVIQ